MAVASITNPEEILYIQPTPSTKLKHSTAFDSEFNAQALEMVEFTERDRDITVCDTKTQVAENLFLKSSGLINFYCTESINSEMIKLNHISLILVAAGADDTITILCVLYLNGSTNHSLLFGGTSLTPRNSSDIRNFPVRKCSPVEAVRIIYVPHDEETNAPVNLNPNYGDFGHGNNGDGGENGNGDGDNNDGFGAAIPINPMIDGSRPIRIYRIQQISNIRSPIIFTNIFANQYRNWDALAGAIYQIYLANTNQENTVNLVFPPDASHCWPGSNVEYGRFEDDTFFCYIWRLHPWETVKHLIMDVLVR